MAEPAGLVEDEELRAARKLDAQAKAVELFEQIEVRGMIQPGVGEVAVSNEVRDLAAELFGVHRHWHKRIVRAGPNTLEPYKENPPDRVIAPDDIVFVDFGPISRSGRPTSAAPSCSETTRSSNA